MANASAKESRRAASSRCPLASASMPSKTGSISVASDGLWSSMKATALAWPSLMDK